MELHRGIGNTAVIPPHSTVGDYAAVPGYLQDGAAGEGNGTFVGAQLYNMLMLEIINVITGNGIALLGTAYDQLAAATRGVRALMAHLTDTGSVTNVEQRAVLASTASRAIGARTLVSVSDLCVIDAQTTEGEITASTACEIDDSGVVNPERLSIRASDLCTAKGVTSSINASQQCTTTDDSGRASVDSSNLCNQGGHLASIRAAQNCDIETDVPNGSALKAAVDASENCDIKPAAVEVAISASDTCIIETGVQNSSIRNSKDCTVETLNQYAEINASHNSKIKASEQKAMIQASSFATQRGSNSVMVASQNCENISNLCVVGGFDPNPITPNGTNQKRMWMLETSDGALGTGIGRFLGGTTNLGLDYAELYENDTPGVIAPAMLIGCVNGKARLAQAGDYLIGVMSVNPGVLGDGHALDGDRYMVDEWGQRLYDADGSPMNRADWQPRAIPPHADKLHYTVVGMLGQLRVRVAKNVREGNFVAATNPDAPGIGYATNGQRAAGASIYVQSILHAWTKERGCAIAWCLVR